MNSISRPVVDRIITYILKPAGEPVKVTDIHEHGSLKPHSVYGIDTALMFAAKDGLVAYDNDHDTYGLTEKGGEWVTELE